MSTILKGRMILGEIYISIHSIKDLLFKDIFLESEGITKEEYIKNLIERLNQITIE